LDRLPVEVWSRKMVTCAPEVDQREVKLVRVLVDTSAASDNLLEFGHRPDLSVENNQATGLHVDSGREQPRGGNEHRIFGFRIHEIAKLRLTLGVIAGDSHYVAAIFGDEVGVLVNQCAPHPGCMLLIHTKNNSLLESVTTLFKEFCDFSCNKLCSFVQHQYAVKVLDVVDAILDLLPFAVDLALLRG
jgi:hypothetical protein